MSAVNSLGQHHEIDLRSKCSDRHTNDSQIHVRSIDRRKAPRGLRVEAMGRPHLWIPELRLIRALRP